MSMFKAGTTRQARSVSGKFLSGFIAVVLAIAGIAGGVAHAQLAGKGELKGTVKDPTGAVVANASVTATDTASGISTTRTSNSSGEYDISPLDAAIYTVSVAAKGFEKQTQDDVHVNALEIADYDVVLTVGSSTETVTVTSAPAALETGNATLGATMEQEMYAALPVEMGAAGSPDQRRATDFAVLMPGVQGNETNGNLTTNTGVVNGSGSRGAASAVYVNGIPFTSVAGEGDTRFVWTAISVDAVDQFQVQTSGYSAMYEGMGVQNYSTKAGGNKYHGALYEYFRNTALDTWGFFAPALTITNPVTGLVMPAKKPRENQNEFGALVSGPIVKDKLFAFLNLDAFRFAHGPLPAYQTLPTQAEYGGNFSDQKLPIYDPTSTVCGAKGCTRTQYPNNTIPASVLSQSKVAQYLQHFLPGYYSLPTTTGNNFVGGYPYGLNNWMTTDRIDWVLNSRNTMSLTFAKGRQVTAGGPASQTTAGRNVTAFAPYNYGQEFAPKTTVWTLQDTYTISSNLVNQFNYGFARYNGPTYNPNVGGSFAATAAGINGLPAGQASTAFPIVSFAGNGSNPTGWAGSVANSSIANSYIATDNVQWVRGKHAITIGTQVAWMEYNYTIDTTGTSPLTIANAAAETEGFLCAKVGSVTPATGTCALSGATLNLDTTGGFSYASFLTGAADSQSLTNNSGAPSTGGRFRPISPYVQDDWKVSSKLTLNLGLRYDYYPTYREQFDRLSFLNPTGTNPATGNLGSLEFAGSHGTISCNCRTTVGDYAKNFGPRLGFAFQSDPKTVWRGSWGVMYTHGNGVGGSATSRNGTGTLGYSTNYKQSYNNAVNYLPSQQLDAGYQGPAPALTGSFGSGYSSLFSTVAVPSLSPQSLGYADPYLGGRAPQYINWSFGMQHALTDSITMTASYVGSEGHFEVTDGGNGRGYWSNQLDPKYLVLGGTNLANKATAANIAAIAALGVVPQNGYPTFDPTQAISTLLKPFPQYGVSDSYSNMANSNYHGLQVSVNKRPSHGLTFMVNYTWSKAIDDGGTFRSGYDIPAAFSGDGKFHKVDSIERGVSTSNQPQHVVISGVYDLPFGKGHLGGGNFVTSALLSNFKFSSIIQMYSGSPLALTASSCGTNAANGTCLPSYNPAFTSHSAKQNGDWGHGGTALSLKTMQFINPAAFIITPSTAAAPLFSNAARTAPYGLYGPGNYNVDISLRRTFGLGFEGAHVMLEGDLYNLTNHTQFGAITTAFTSTSGNAGAPFGTVGTQANNSRAAQLTARIEF